MVLLELNHCPIMTEYKLMYDIVESNAPITPVRPLVPILDFVQIVR